MEIRKEIKERLNHFKEIRRTLHQNPEIGFNIHHTLEYIEKLVNMKSANNDSGVFYLPGTKSCIAFRCELDALPIKEINDIEYKSKNDSMHACGHDAHMAILIETMFYFMNHPHDHALLFIFQPAEESGAGSKHMIQLNIFEKYQITELYATHVLPSLGNKIGCREGIVMAKSCEIKIIIHGKSAHAATPNHGIDTLYVTNKFLNFIYEYQKDITPNILHIGKCINGEVCNAVSSKTVLEGTIRSFDNNYFDEIKNTCIKQIELLDKEFNTRSILSFSDGYDLLINHPSLVSKLKRNCINDYVEVMPMALSEDFSFYTSLCPSCYYFCGLTSDTSLHENTFDLDEEECLKAIELNIRLVEDNTFDL